MPVGVAARRPREAPHVAVNPETERQLEETRAKIELLQNVTEERMRSLTRDELVGVVGDLLALAGAETTVGREAVATYNESNAGRRPGAKPGGLTISPWWDANASALEPLPHVSAAVPAGFGERDDRVEAYDFRLCMTDSKQNSVPLRRPAAYNASEWELWRRLYRM